MLSRLAVKVADGFRHTATAASSRATRRQCCSTQRSSLPQSKTRPPPPPAIFDDSVDLALNSLSRSLLSLSLSHEMLGLLVNLARPHRRSAALLVQGAVPSSAYLTLHKETGWVRTTRGEAACEVAIARAVRLARSVRVGSRGRVISPTCLATQVPRESHTLLGVAASPSSQDAPWLYETTQ